MTHGKIPHHEASCPGKTPYSTPQLAHRAAKFADRNCKKRNYSGMRKGGIRVYRCTHCGFFHLGGPR